MPIRSLPFDEIEAKHIEDLKERGIREDRTLDYKEDLATDDRGKFEVLKDICAMANASGGNLVYGVQEGDDDERGLIVNLRGLEIEPEKIQQWIDNLLRDCVDERIPGVLHKAVEWKNGRHFFVIRVPASALAPHMIVNVATRRPRFYCRANTTNDPMNARQIKEVALKSEAAVDRALALAEESANQLRDKFTEFGDQALLHVIPLFPPPEAFDLTEPAQVNRLKAVPALGSSGRYSGELRFALEDLYHEAPNSVSPVRYVLLHRGGALEFQKRNILTEHPDHPEHLVLAPRPVEEAVIAAIDAALDLAEAGLFWIPAIVSFRLLNVQDSVLHRPAGHVWDTHWEQSGFRAPFARPDMQLEPWMLTERGTAAQRQIKRMFDAMWQAYGWERCLNYGSDGERIERR